METNLLKAKSQELKAVLDLGTNTFHLLIAELSEHGFREILQKQIPVKIGAGGINNGFLTPQAWERGINAIQEFSEIIQSYSIHSIVATGTSAIRNAKNGLDFLAEIESRFGIIVKSISGDTEASLIYLGVSKSFEFPNEPILVMDIGGGSVEFIIGIQNQILWKQSFEIGAARLLEKFQPSNPIRILQIQEIESYLTAILNPLKLALVQTETKYKKLAILVGSAGSFETLLDVLKLDLNIDCESLTPFAHRVSLDAADKFFDCIMGSNKTERENLKGLLDFRVDMIVVATLLMRLVLRNFGLNQLIASNYALKEGLLLSENL
ncbi:MAG: exopolyphosphatase [Bacteroidia bacterium]|nr:exopolyphosphatase [Bacteroidia bacterium]